MNSYLYLLSAIISQNEVDIPRGAVTQGGTVGTLLKLVFGVAGGVALLMVTYGGFKYVLSRGNPQETAKAKDTILYALIGLVICIFAFSVVTFVVGRL